MKIKILVLLLVSHAIIGFVGFAAGIYALPILIAPDSPDAAEINAMSATAEFKASFKKDLQDSDFLHQGEGEVTVGSDVITFTGQISPGPDYKLYLSPSFVETEAEFKRLKATMVVIGDIKTFDNFVVPVGKDVNVGQYNTVIVWCESFGQFITAAQYQ